MISRAAAAWSARLAVASARHLHTCMPCSASAAPLEPNRRPPTRHADAARPAAHTVCMRTAPQPRARQPRTRGGRRREKPSPTPSAHRRPPSAHRRQKAPATGSPPREKRRLQAARSPPAPAGRPRTMAAKKAAAAATAVRSGTGKKMVKRRTKVHFYRPKSFQPPKAPKYALKAAPAARRWTSTASSSTR